MWPLQTPYSHHPVINTASQNIPVSKTKAPVWGSRRKDHGGSKQKVLWSGGQHSFDFKAKCDSLTPLPSNWDMQLTCACKYVEVGGGGGMLYPPMWGPADICACPCEQWLGENNKAGPSGNWMSWSAFLAELVRKSCCERGFAFLWLQADWTDGGFYFTTKPPLMWGGLIFRM